MEITNEECVICFQVLSDMIKDNCCNKNRNYCQQCYYKIKGMSKPSCPFCRKKISNKFGSSELTRYEIYDQIIRTPIGKQSIIEIFDNFNPNDNNNDPYKTPKKAKINRDIIEYEVHQELKQKRRKIEL
jgi:hypothetical protein